MTEFGKQKPSARAETISWHLRHLAVRIKGFGFPRKDNMRDGEG